MRKIVKAAIALASLAIMTAAPAMPAPSIMIEVGICSSNGQQDSRLVEIPANPDKRDSGCKPCHACLPDRKKLKARTGQG